MLWQFRRELIQMLMEDAEVYISTPFVGHEKDFADMGCHMIETPVDRRGINPMTDLRLYKQYRAMLKKEKPDMVITYSIKPNVYAGYACRRLHIPYCVNVQGLGTAFEKPGLSQVVTMMYRTALKGAKTVFFEMSEMQHSSGKRRSLRKSSRRSFPEPASLSTSISTKPIRKMKHFTSCIWAES